MTAQIPDSVALDGVEHELVAIDGTGLFDPRDHDVEFVMTSTANYRGFQACYEIRDDRLILVRLIDVGLEAAQGGAPLDALPRIADVAPTYGRRGLGYELDLPTSFTGALLIADEFLHDLYVHMGFHPAWKYERVHELILEDGAVLRVHDRSEQIEQRRNEILTGARRDPDATDDVVTWIARSFERDWGRSLGS